MTQNQRPGHLLGPGLGAAPGTVATAGLPTPSRRGLLQGGLALGAVLTLPGLSACSPGSSPAPGEEGGGEPRRGGNLRIGLSGGSSSDTLDPHAATASIDYHRMSALYDFGYWPDADFVYQPMLVEEATPNADATVWTIRVRDGIEFHHGKTLDAEDLIFSLNRIYELPYSGLSGRFAVADLKNLRKIDARTVEIPMKEPFSIFTNQFAQLAIVPVGFDPAKPVGTGPFAFESFSPGNESVFKANPNWWGGIWGATDAPYVDQLQIVDLADDSARVNALLSGQVDAIDNVPYAQAQVLTAQQMQLFDVPTGNWRPFTMRVDAEPFSDVRVRQAMRLIVDREQMVTQALNGFGVVGNDLYSPQDPNVESLGLPQRTQDLDQARFLLQQAGYPDLAVELVTSPIAAGVVEASSVLASQAKAAGVSIDVRKVDSGTFYGKEYLSWPFAVDWWTPLPYLDQAVTADGPTASFNETHWDDEEFTSYYYAALKETDPGKRAPIEQEMMRIQHERGGYIIWGFANTVDAHSPKVNGLVETKYGQSLSDSGFWRMWLD
jgi:peptide/nickel transport system substrate-binding protein